MHTYSHTREHTQPPTHPYTHTSTNEQTDLHPSTLPTVATPRQRTALLMCRPPPTKGWRMGLCGPCSLPHVAHEVVQFAKFVFFQVILVCLGCQIIHSKNASQELNGIGRGRPPSIMASGGGEPVCLPGVDPPTTFSHSFAQSQPVPHVGCQSINFCHLTMGVMGFGRPSNENRPGGGAAHATPMPQGRAIDGPTTAHLLPPCPPAAPAAPPPRGQRGRAQLGVRPSGGPSLSWDSCAGAGEPARGCASPSFGFPRCDPSRWPPQLDFGDSDRRI